MESLKISTGVIRLRIENDYGEERGIFQFNPEDIHSAKAVLALQKELNIKQKEFEEARENLETDEDRVDFLESLVEYFESAIDKCFGEGTSELLFGDAKTLSMFNDFFEGITPYYQESSKKRIAKYKKSGK